MWSVLYYQASYQDDESVLKAPEREVRRTTGFKMGSVGCICATEICGYVAFMQQSPPNRFDRIGLPEKTRPLKENKGRVMCG